MDFGWLIDSGVGSELERYILNHAALKPGDKLEGKVIEVKANGNILIHFGKFRAVAESRLPIKEGDVINVVVVSKRPKLKLRLETPHAKDSSGTGNFLRRLEMVPEDQWSNIRPVLQKLLDIDNVAEVLFPPGMKEILEESEKNVKLKIYAPGSGTRLSLLVDAERLGKIRCDFHLVERKLNITFFVRNDRLKDYLEKHLARVRQGLEGRFQYLVLHVIVSERKVVEFDSEDLDAGMSGSKMLDVKV